MSRTNPRLLPFIALALVLPVASSAQSAAPDLSDAEVAHIAVTANTIDVDFAQLAETRAKAPRVKQFATTMINDHTAVNEKASALAGKLGVTPKDNGVSQSLLKGAAEARKTIEPLEGSAFDRAYMEREVAYHQAVIDALDQTLIPTTENAELKALLVQVRPNFVAHLAYAKKLAASVTAAK